jgi:rSAM-associated Gly-rich repeat protein
MSMTLRNSTLKALSALLPAGAFGMSVALAAAPSVSGETAAVHESAAASVATSESVSDRLQAIRSGVSAVTQEPFAEPDIGTNIVKVWWGNGGWRRGWGNGGGRPGWGKGGWRPGWGNGGWGNGGWGNGGWRNGGWPNFWRNW